jgi:iron-sulfur cluster assembly accessory protein
MLTVTENAVSRLTEISKEKIGEGEGLRLFLSAGGCGCSVSFGIGIDEQHDGDVVDENSGLRFLMDAQASSALEGASIDYVDDVMRQGFAIDAPNAPSAPSGGGCACGS